jgi:predicted kinase
MTAPTAYSSTYIVISGIPASGKTTLGRQLATSLFWPVIDKDAFLEQLFRREKEIDSAKRRLLSRKSDDLLREAARREQRAVIVSFWHVRGMPDDSGTPTDWLAASADRIVGVHCACDAAVAARRFNERVRHPAHGDSARGLDQLTAEFANLAKLETPVIDSIVVDTGRQVDIPALSTAIHARLRTS